MWFVCFGKTARVTFCQFGTIYGADDERCNAKRSVVLVVIMCEANVHGERGRRRI